MKRALITIAGTAAGVLLLGAGIFLFVIYTGAYNVAATKPHRNITRWALSTLQHNSVAARATEVGAPPAMDSAALAHGFEHFHAMCVQCHGAPGMDRGELGKGITPTPPRLELEASEWTDAELFWITKNGIRLAGMPAFGPTHGDAELWSIVAFIRKLETMTEEEYAAMVRAGSPPGSDSAGSGGHSHAPGTPAHAH